MTHDLTAEEKVCSYSLVTGVDTQPFAAIAHVRGWLVRHYHPQLWVDVDGWMDGRRQALPLGAPEKRTIRGPGLALCVQPAGSRVTGVQDTAYSFV
jgi:hypothetical protein